MVQTHRSDVEVDGVVSRSCGGKLDGTGKGFPHPTAAIRRWIVTTVK